MTESGTDVLTKSVLFALLTGIAFMATVAPLPAELIVLPEGQTMGTTYHIKLVSTSLQLDSIQVGTEIQELLQTVNRQMSTYDPESEISQFNSAQSTDWFPVSSATAAVTAKAIEVSELSNGAFDPTVGPLVRLWGFGSDPRLRKVPTDEQIAHARASVGYRLLAVQREPPAIRKTHPETELDLSAIAKGYGVDVVSQWLAQQPQISAWMVEIGGEVRVHGTKEDGSLWKLAIERPAVESRELGYFIDLNNESLATSGDYRNYFEVDGQRYSHTLNPQTGRPITHALASVSVVAADCMTADAVATAINVLGPEEGLQWAEAHDVAAFLLVRQDQGFVERSTTAASRRFAPLLAGQATDQTMPATSPWVTVLITIVVFALAMGGLAIGVIVSNRRLKGTCGGLQGLKDATGQSACEMCSTPVDQCEQFREKVAQSTKGSPNVDEPT